MRSRYAIVARCTLCGPKTARAKIIEGQCGRCRHAQKRKPPPDTEYMRKWRARRGCKTVMYVAFDSDGHVTGVYSKVMANHLTAIGVEIRPFHLNKMLGC